jgi:hypothetical protein
LGVAAEQEALEPPLVPAQDQFHGPVPVTADAVPVVQRLVVGVTLVTTPFIEPHKPFTDVPASEAEQPAVEPPLLPMQLHVQGPEPLVDEAVPVVQRPIVGAELTAALLAAPHWPFTGVTASEAEQLAVVPPLEPAHDQVHGPEPLVADAVPVLQRFVVGALLTVVPFALPQAPLMGAGLQVGLPLLVTEMIDEPWLVCVPFVQR